MDITIFHNPSCSKSRSTLQLIRERNIEPEVIEYLNTPPSHEQIAHLLHLLALEPRQLMRSKESVYRDLGLDDPVLGSAELIDAMVRHPILIQRPIVVYNGKAAIGRPPESVLEIL